MPHQVVEQDCELKHVDDHQEKDAGVLHGLWSLCLLMIKRKNHKDNHERHDEQTLQNFDQKNKFALEVFALQETHQDDEHVEELQEEYHQTLKLWQPLARHQQGEVDAHSQNIDQLVVSDEEISEDQEIVVDNLRVQKADDNLIDFEVIKRFFLVDYFAVPFQADSDRFLQL